MSNEDSIKNHRSAAGSPPVAVLSATRNWSLSIVLYPSGPCLELVEVVDGCGARIAHSARLDNLDAHTTHLPPDKLAARPKQTRPHPPAPSRVSTAEIARLVRSIRKMLETVDAKTDASQFQRVGTAPHPPA